MSERRITAVVLLAGTTTPHSLRDTLSSLQAQTRQPDAICVVTTAGLTAETEQALASARVDGIVDDVQSHPAAVGPMAAIRLALGETPPGHGLCTPTGASEDDDTPQAQETSPQQAAPHERPGRRMREIDPREQARRLESEAEDLAQVPARLREERRRGRRIDTSAIGAGESWLWFIPDGAAPGRESLSWLEHTVEQSPRTAVVGSKRLFHGATAAVSRPNIAQGTAQETSSAADEEQPQTADDAVSLLDVGITLTYGGRIATGVDPGEIDQGQADWRQDVLAVALAGMLVREETVRDLDGFDVDLPQPWAEIDFCERVWRSGERVAVQARSRVMATPADAEPHETVRDHRRGQVLSLLKQRGPVGAIALLLALPLITLVRAVFLLLIPQPRRAVAEIAALGDVLRLSGRVMRRGARSRRAARVPRRRLAPLYLPRGEDLRQQVDTTWTRLFADDERTRRARLTSWGIAGTRHGVEDATYGRHLAWTGALAVLSVIGTLVVLRGLLGRGDLSGPALIPMPQTLRDAFAAAWSSWVPGDLGARGPADPLLRLLGSLPLPGELFVETIVFAAIPVSALAAWFAAGALTRAIGARLVAAVLWALAPPLLSALSLGAWPLLLAHMLMPLLALAVGRAVGLPHKVHRASVPSAAAAGLLLLVIGAVQPVLLALAAVIGLLIAAVVPGRRRRLLWVLVPSLALHAPYIPQYIGHPQLVLAVGGMPAPTQVPTPLDLLALWPQTPLVREPLLAFLPPVAVTALLLVPVILVLPAALGASVLGGPAGALARLGLLGAAAGILVIAWARSVDLEITDGLAVGPPLHALLGFVLLTLAAAALCGYDAAARRDESVGRARRVLSSVLAAGVAAGAAATVALWSVYLPGSLQIERTSEVVVPTAASDLGRSEARGRVLVLEAGEEPGMARASVLTQGQDSVAQRSAIVELRRLEAARSDAKDPASAALREAAAQLLSPGAVADGEALRTLAIGYVVVPGEAEQQRDLVDALDSSTVLEKVTQTTSGGLWRVADAAPRARVTTASDSTAQGTALRSDTITASGRVSAEGTDRLVVLSERADSDWVARVDGQRLEPTVVDGWAQGFTLPADVGGTVQIDREQPGTLIWQILLLSATVLTALVAVPWRPRTRGIEDLYG